MKFRLVFLFVFLPGILLPQKTDVLKNLQNKFKTVSDFSADFRQSVSGAGKITGKFFYKKKNKFFVGLKSQMIVSDGTTLWNYDTRMKRTVISNLADEPSSFSLEKYIYDYPALCNKKISSSVKDGRENFLIELVPKDDDLDFKSVKIWTDSDYLVNKIEITDLADTKYFLELSDFLLNQSLPDSKFEFSPPKGTQIIDLR